MADRRAHLVGSLPGENAEQAMRNALDRTGSSLPTVTDGETGDRDRWVVGTILSLANHPDLEVSKTGDWSDYKQQQNYRVRNGHRFTGENLDLGYLADYRASRPIFERLKKEYDLADLTFQVGIPGDLDLSLFAMSPTGMLKHRKAFTTAVSRQIAEIQRESGGEVVFQLEIPAEMVFVIKSGPLAPAVAKWMASGVRKLIAAAPIGTRFGVHLCLGDLGHKALGQTKTAAPMVTLANAIANAWPPGRTLEFLHAPLAAGDVPPSTDPAFYGPLTRLRLPIGTRFIAGFLHEGRTLDEQREILATIEKLVGNPVDVAASCGLGRRGTDNANTVLDQGAALAAATPDKN